jgi:CheY-like chemotaxis protein
VKFLNGPNRDFPKWRRHTLEPGPLFGMLARNFRPISLAYLTMSAACLRTIETNRNLVSVVDDDPRMLRGVQRLLGQHAYQPILFSSPQDFKSHTDFEKAACVILDINLNDGSEIDLRHRLKADGHSVPVIYKTASDNPARSQGCAGLWMHRVSNQAIFNSGADRPLKRAGRHPTAATCSNAPASLPRALRA